MHREELLIVKISESYWGIVASKIRAILNVQAITTTPMLPSAQRGFSAVNSDILEVYDFSAILGTEESSVDVGAKNSKMILIKELDKSFLLLVEEVLYSEIVNFNRSDLNQEHIIAFEHKGRVIQMLPFHKLFKQNRPLEKNPAKITNFESNSKEREKKSIKMSSLIFTVESEYFAIEADAVDEIVAMPLKFTSIYSTENEIEGVVSLKERLVVAINLRKYYNLGGVSSTDGYMVVIKHKGSYMALIVDEVTGIENISSDIAGEMLGGIYDGKADYIVQFKNMVLAVVGERALGNLLELKKNIHIEKKIELKRETQIDKVMVFNDEFALSVESIGGVFSADEILPIAKSSEFVRGLINVRGEATPVLSLNRLLRIKDDSANEKQEREVIVCCNSRANIGLSVYSVSDIFYVNRNEVLKEHERSGYFSKTLKLSGVNGVVKQLDVDMLSRRVEQVSRSNDIS